MILNTQQTIATEKACDWHKRFLNNFNVRPYFEISGPAGSGKTTIVRTITEMLGLDSSQVIYMALVGKATLALVRNGVPAKTIHSSIYEYGPIQRTDSLGDVMLDSRGKPLFDMSFMKKEILGKDIRLLVVDEGAMVSSSIANDIMSYGIPVIVLGDLNQLPPVFGKSFFLSSPDVILTEIMRQALENPIIALSNHVLHYGHKLEPKVWGPKCRVIRKEEVNDDMLRHHDIIICGKNATRDEINGYVRGNLLGIHSRLPVKGDILLSRQNNWNLSIGEGICLVNGMTGTVEDVYMESFNGNSLNIDFRPDFITDNEFHNIPLDYKYLTTPCDKKTSNERSRFNKFEYGYAITGHLSQGSQYNSVLVYQESFGGWDFSKRWLYTVATRAIDELTIAI